MKCENCKKREVDGIIMLGGLTLKVCSPKCMEELLSKLKEAKDVSKGEKE